MTTTQINLAGTTTAIVSPIPLGSSVYDTATITQSDGLTPTGTVTYTFYLGGDCSGAAIDAGILPLNGDGTVPDSNTQGPLQAGSYSFLAAYSGDANYTASTSTCEPFVVANGDQFGGAPSVNAGRDEYCGRQPDPAGQCTVHDTATYRLIRDGLIPTGNGRLATPSSTTVPARPARAARRGRSP